MKRTQYNNAYSKATHSIQYLMALFITIFGLGLSSSALAGELVVNGGFEEPEVPDIYGVDGRRWATYFGQNGAALAADYCSTNNMNAHCIDEVLVPGWSSIWRDTLATTSEPGRIELQYGEFNGCSASEMFQKAELDSHHHYNNMSEGENNIYLYQMLPTCPRKPYVLHYDWKPREPLTSDMDVWIDGVKVCEHFGWESAWLPVGPVYFISGDDPGSELGFDSCGYGNTFGAFIDAVSVQGPTPDDPECYEPEPICGERPNQLKLMYDGDRDGLDFHSQNPKEVIVNRFSADPLPDNVLIKAFDWRGKFKNAAKGKKGGDVTPFFMATVRRNMDIFTMNSPAGQKWLPPTTYIQIWSEGSSTQPAELLQTVQFHTSCSQPLNVGDEFGAIVLWAGGRN